MNRIFANLLGLLTPFLSVIFLIYLVYKSRNIYFRIKTFFREKKMVKNNIIPIVHNNNSTYSSKLFGGNDDMININTHMDFIKKYEKMDKDKDIVIVMHTLGGALTCAEAISNCILNHKGKGKIICIVPYYAYSAGCFIALCCDKIIMSKNSILGPCDAQKPVGALQTYSISSILKTINYKISKNDKIKEDWLASSFDAELCKTRQSDFLNKIMIHGKMDGVVKDRVYEEFFSGKYNHDKIFSAQDAKEIGVNIEIIEEIPKDIKDIIEYYM